MGGGPIQGGRVVGESDELGYAPKTRPVTPGEVAATLYRGLGLDPHRELPGPQNRPMPLVDYRRQADQGVVLSSTPCRASRRAAFRVGSQALLRMVVLLDVALACPGSASCSMYPRRGHAHRAATGRSSSLVVDEENGRVDRATVTADGASSHQQAGVADREIGAAGIVRAGRRRRGDDHRDRRRPHGHRQGDGHEGRRADAAGASATTSSRSLTGRLQLRRLPRGARRQGRAEAVAARLRPRRRPLRPDPPGPRPPRRSHRARREPDAAQADAAHARTAAARSSRSSRATTSVLPTGSPPAPPGRRTTDADDRAPRGLPAAARPEAEGHAAA